MKSVRFIGILIILLLTIGSASADVVLTKEVNQGSVLISVTYDVNNSTITFLDQSNVVNDPGIIGIAYNLNVDAQLITGYKKNSNDEQILFNGNSNNKDGYVWKKINKTDTSGEASNLLRFYSVNTENVERFQKVVVKVPNFNGNIPADSIGNQVGIQYLCDQFTGFISGPAGNSATESGNNIITNENPAITLEITALSNSYSTEGQKLQYGFVVKNTGNVAITNLSVIDSKLGTVSLPSNTLNPGQITSMITVYTVSKADIDTGSVTNNAYVSGKYKNNIIQSNNAIATIKADTNSVTNTTSSGKENNTIDNSNEIAAMVTGQSPTLTFEVSVSPNNYSTEGQKIEFDYFVTNTGNNPVKDVKVTDKYLGTVSISNTTLEPKNSISASAIYTITKEDINLGKVDSLSKATGTYNSNIISSNLVSTEIKADTEIPEFPSIVLPVAAILGLLFLSQHKGKEK